MGTKPANKKSKKSTQEPPPRYPPVEWTFTKKFLPDLVAGEYHRDREAMLAWIRELQSPLRAFCLTELSGARYQSLGKMLTNDEENWLKQIPEMVEKAMTFSAADIAARQSEGFDTQDPDSDRDMHFVHLMRRICDSAGMPIPAIGAGRSRAGQERARLRYRVAYGLLLTTLSNLQHVRNGDFQSAIGTHAIQPWPDSTTSSHKRASSRSPPRRREAKKKKPAAPPSPGSDPDFAPVLPETTYLRARLQLEERLRKEAEAKLTAVREAISALETAVEKIKAAVQ
ncbi:hypothetical protein AC578_3410 [Pseudocercospora eumusae]|uniref:Uncharacterized protein n=1 Tax=Pseudocercospora eumusae TaxID=321146 RepID=A0A139GUK2_9PEZI|nr:hypothetical protein AC578_3410 [Pseudocercospora eumusae]